MNQAVANSDKPDIVQQSMKMAYDGVLDEPLPPWMISAITSPKRRYLINGLLATAVLCVGVLLGVGLKSLSSSSDPVVVAKLPASDLGSQVHNLFSLDPVDPVQIQAEDRAFLNLWVSHRLGRSYQLPDLTSAGLDALGVRIVQDGSAAAALSVFEDAEQNRVSLLARVGQAVATPSEAKFSISAQSSRLEWAQGDFVYALVGDNSKSQLEEIKKEIFY